ncbi:MAG: 2-oxo acid dehydrogenase subunit E2 [Chloroflexi bacterium]|nr:2-oxo acid dehydrogenase subunit E2 [Chloroflexota bacterium]
MHSDWILSQLEYFDRSRPANFHVKATISVDHRVSDGAEAAQFMQKLAEFLKNPVRMLV